MKNLKATCIKEINWPCLAEDLKYFLFKTLNEDPELNAIKILDTVTIINQFVINNRIFVEIKECKGILIDFLIFFILKQEQNEYSN